MPRLGLPIGLVSLLVVCASPAACGRTDLEGDLIPVGGGSCGDACGSVDGSDLGDGGSSGDGAPRADGGEAGSAGDSSTGSGDDGGGGLGDDGSTDVDASDGGGGGEGGPEAGGGNDGGGRGDAGGGGTEGGVVDAGTPVTCGTTTCDPSSEECCVGFGGNGVAASCSPKGQCVGVTLPCTGSDNCSGGDVCCVSLGRGLPTASCQASCGGGGFGGGIQLCQSNADCTPGRCIPTPLGVNVCL